MNVLITGGNGYIANGLFSSLKHKHNIKTINRNDFDLIDTKKTNSWFKDKYFDVVIHTAIQGGSRLRSDDFSIVEYNLKMFNNLCNNKDRYGRLISFGSGAEIYASEKPYGLSKKLIFDKIIKLKNFYNIRIFGLFDENELDTRFIKSNIQRYIKKEPMIIHSNRMMDFFYMVDFVNLVDHYITSVNLEKEVNCSYDEKFTLVGIAKLINQLNEHKVQIKIENNNIEMYCGQNVTFPIETLGLKLGISQTYNKLMDIV